MEALNMKYGQRFEAEKAFAEVAEERGLSAERLGGIMANEEIFQMEYNEGKNALIQDMARVLGMSEAALRGSDPELTAISGYAGNLYDRVRSGEITPSQAAEELKLTGMGRIGASLAGGSRGDLSFMSGNSIGATISDGVGDHVKNAAKFVATHDFKQDVQQLQNDIKSEINRFKENGFDGLKITPSNTVDKTKESLPGQSLDENNPNHQRYLEVNSRTNKNPLSQYQTNNVPWKLGL